MMSRKWYERNTQLYEKLRGFDYDQASIMVIIMSGEERGKTLQEMIDMSEGDAEYLLQEAFREWSNFRSNVGL